MNTSAREQSILEKNIAFINSNFWTNHQHFWRSNEEIRRHAHNLLQKMNPSSSALKILDISNGDSRYAQYFCEHGHKVLLLAMNATLLEKNKDKLANNQNIELFHWELSKNSTLASLPNEILLQNFDLILCHQGRFGLFEENENYLFLQTISRLLKKNGCISFDLRIAETYAANGFIHSLEKSIAEYLVTEARQFIEQSNTVESKWKILKKDNTGSPIYLSSSYRLYSIQELLKLLESVNLSVDLYSQYLENPYTRGERLFALAFQKDTLA